MSHEAFIDPTAKIGNGTLVWHYAIVLAGVEIGDNCSIGSGAEIGRGTLIGSGTRISSGVFLPSNSRVGQRVFIGPGATFCDDKYPRAGNPGYEAQPPHIEDGASIGAGAVILPGVRIGAGAMIGAGSVIVRDVEPGQTIHGDYARLTRS